MSTQLRENITSGSDFKKLCMAPSSFSTRHKQCNVLSGYTDGPKKLLEDISAVHWPITVKIIWYTVSCITCQHFCWKLHKCVVWVKLCSVPNLTVFGQCVLRFLLTKFVVLFFFGPPCVLYNFVTVCTASSCVYERLVAASVAMYLACLLKHLQIENIARPLLWSLAVARAYCNTVVLVADDLMFCWWCLHVCLFVCVCVCLSDCLSFMIHLHCYTSSQGSYKSWKFPRLGIRSLNVLEKSWNWNLWKLVEFQSC